MSENEDKKNMTEDAKEKEVSNHPPKFTNTHGMVPDVYVPAWKTNVVSKKCNAISKMHTLKF